MAIELLTLKTEIVAANADEADDLDNATIIRPFIGGAYNLDQLHAFAAQVRASARETLIRASVIVAQIRKETANFRYGGQVPASAFNFAGIGATNGGAAGRAFKDIPTGVKAVFAHHMNYLVGKRALWPARWDGYRELAVRNQAVLDAGYGGVVTTIGDYTNGRWAWSPQYPTGTLLNGYATSIVALANEMRAGSSVLVQGQGPVTPPGKGTTMAAPKIAIASGHHNEDGVAAFEYTQTGELAEALARHCARLGMDVRVIQPDGPDADTERGDGMFPGGMWDVAKAVVTLKNQGWVPDIFIECHTEGGGTTGVFAIYPDWDGDVDADVKTKLGPLVAQKVAAATGLALRRAGRDGIKGVASEKETGVGISGFRLGISNLPAAIASTTTRLIVEYGAHDKEPDLTIVKRPGFYDAAGKATAEAFAAFMACRYRGAMWSRRQSKTRDRQSRSGISPQGSRTSSPGRPLPG